LNKAYSKEKPAWINVVAIFSVLFVLFSWYKAWSSNIEYGWIFFYRHRQIRWKWIFEHFKQDIFHYKIRYFPT